MPLLNLPKASKPRVVTLPDGRHGRSASADVAMPVPQKSTIIMYCVMDCRAGLRILQPEPFFGRLPLALGAPLGIVGP